MLCHFNAKFAKVNAKFAKVLLCGRFCKNAKFAKPLQQIKVSNQFKLCELYVFSTASKHIYFIIFAHFALKSYKEQKALKTQSFANFAFFQQLLNTIYFIIFAYSALKSYKAQKAQKTQSFANFAFFQQLLNTSIV